VRTPLSCWKYILAFQADTTFLNRNAKNPNTKGHSSSPPFAKSRRREVSPLLQCETNQDASNISQTYRKESKWRPFARSRASIYKKPKSGPKLLTFAQSIQDFSWVAKNQRLCNIWAHILAESLYCENCVLKRILRLDFRRRIFLSFFNKKISKQNCVFY